MSLKLSGWSDTIVALATPPGVGAIGVIRISGSRAVSIIDGLFPSKNLNDQPSHTLHVGLLKDGDAILDEVVVSLYRAPRSFTGEDVVEVSTHGSAYVQQRVMEAVVKHGARLAKAGEFTMRAFLNGKMDLVQAEAVADVIASDTEAALKTALTNIRGGFSRSLKALREQLLTFSALIELELDFAEEDVEFADRSALLKLVREAGEQTSLLVKSFRVGNVIRNGVSVAIIGKPNAGKSTLLNALLNEERAIVSDIPGTTRDTVEEVVNIEGILFRLIDTAGIREHSEDVIENFGMEKSREKMRNADLVVYLFDAASEDHEVVGEKAAMLENQSNEYILVGNKMDMLNDSGREAWQRDYPSLISISARDGDGLEELKQAMIRKVMAEEIRSESVVVTNARHYGALRQVEDALRDIEQGLEARLSGDLVALDIRRCLQYLGEITGEITNEDQLDFIFSKFCIGK